MGDPQPHRGTLTPLVPLSLRAIEGEGEEKTEASACALAQALASSLVLGKKEGEGLLGCGVLFFILFVGFWVGDGRRWPEAVPLFPFGQILDMRPGEAHRPRGRRNEMLSAVFNQVTAIPAPVVSRNGRLLPPDAISAPTHWARHQRAWGKAWAR